ncbi:LysR family transcriptional regulator [Lachnospiraceae bacterium 66-29]
MTLQQLKYMIIVAERGSITEAAKELYISQPSLSGAIKEVEKESGITIFSRCRAGVALTKEGMEFLGYARQVVQQMELLESKYSDLGILYLCNSNENVLRKLFEEYNLNFFELFTATPHIFIGKDHPLAKCASVRLDDLKPYPRLSFVQGTYESSNYSEELFSNEPAERSIKVSDRAAIVNLMIGLDGYTISSGIFPKYLQGDSIISIPLEEDEVMHIGYILNKDKELSELGEIYVEALKQYQT